MIREIAIILIILVIIFSGNFIVINHLQTTTEGLVAKITEINENIENKEEAEKLINELNEEWERTSQTWAIIVSHQELDQIEISLLSAKTAIANEDNDEAEIELSKLEFLLEHINEKEAFLLKNVF